MSLKQVHLYSGFNEHCDEVVSHFKINRVAYRESCKTVVHNARTMIQSCQTRIEWEMAPCCQSAPVKGYMASTKANTTPNNRSKDAGHASFASFHETGLSQRSRAVWGTVFAFIVGGRSVRLRMTEWGDL